MRKILAMLALFVAALFTCAAGCDSTPPRDTADLLPTPTPAKKQEATPTFQVSDERPKKNQTKGGKK